MRALLRTLAPFAVAAALLAAAFAFVFYSAALPASLAGIKVYGPYIVFALGAALATSFNRGRAVFALLALVIAYAAQQAWLQQGLDAPFPPARSMPALTVFVPAFLALLAVLPERGIINRHGAGAALRHPRPRRVHRLGRGVGPERDRRLGVSEVPRPGAVQRRAHAAARHRGDRLERARRDGGGAHHALRCQPRASQGRSSHSRSPRTCRRHPSPFRSLRWRRS